MRDELINQLWDALGNGYAIKVVRIINDDGLLDEITTFVKSITDYGNDIEVGCSDGVHYIRGDIDFDFILNAFIISTSLCKTYIYL